MSKFPTLIMNDDIMIAIEEAMKIYNDIDKKKQTQTLIKQYTLNNIQ